MVQCPSAKLFAWDQLLGTWPCNSKLNSQSDRQAMTVRRGKPTRKYDFETQQLRTAGLGTIHVCPLSYPTLSE